jgi:hypothetical protein
MGKITIVGSQAPSTHLPTGQVRTVERTPFINKLISGGFVTVVPDPAPVSVPEPDQKSETVDESKPEPRKRTRRQTADTATDDSESDG